jgi:uncharacterized protein
MADASVRGRILWYELMTTDMDAAERFYTAVVGWTTTVMSEPPNPYKEWMRSADVPVGGLMLIPQGMPFPPHWGMYVGVPNLEAAVAQVEKLKGKALSPVIEVPNIGRMRTMADPQGAAFSVYEPANPPSPEAKPKLRDVSWNELMTTDAAAGLKFYSEMFGWKERNSMDMGPMGMYYIWGREWDMGGMMNKPAEMAQVPPHWGFYFQVDDVHKGAERVKQNGGQVMNGPMEVPGGTWIVNCVDPQGAHFSLHHGNV